MSEPKFTPGPWEHRKAGKVIVLAGDPREYPDHIVKIDRDERGRRRTVFVAICESATLPNGANAQLISKAPQLYAVLTAALRNSMCDGDLCCHEWHEEARKLITEIEEE